MGIARRFITAHPASARSPGVAALGDRRQFVAPDSFNVFLSISFWSVS
jgi:hypothetical protein